MKPDTASTAPTPRRNPNLEREKVLEVALALLNEVGFEGLTLRKLAEKLGVKAAALYWHFENKQDLINQLAGRIMATESMTAAQLLEQASWRDLLSGTGDAMRRALMKYRDGALVIASADMTKSNNIEARDILIRELVGYGMPLEVIFTAIFSITRYALGCVFEEQADPRSQTDAAAFRTQMLAKLAEKYAATDKIFLEMQKQHVLAPEQQFRQGLELLLDGIEKKLTA